MEKQRQPYFRGPHTYLAMPKRFSPGKVTIPQNVAEQLLDNPSYHRSTSDKVLKNSRGGFQYDRSFHEKFIDPGPTPRDWIARGNTLACGIVPHRDHPQTPLLYRTSHYPQPSAHLACYSLRVDDFASLYVSFRSGNITARPICFAGDTVRAEGWRRGALVISHKSPIFGEASLDFRRAPFLAMPITRHLGTQVTFTATCVQFLVATSPVLICDVSPKVPNELTIDFDANDDLGDESVSIHFHYCETKVVVPSSWIPDFSGQKDSQQVHHFAVTRDDDVVVE